MNKNIVKSPSPNSKTQKHSSHIQQKSTSHNSKPSKGSIRSNVSSQDKTDLSPKIQNTKFLIKDPIYSEGKHKIPIDLSQSQSIQSNQIDFSKLNSKAYIKIINRLFKYLKRKLSHEIYNDIKRQFSEEAHGYINKITYCLFRNDESQSSIFNYLKCDDEIFSKGSKEKLLKLSCDFSKLSGKEKPVKIEGKIKTNSNDAMKSVPVFEEIKSDDQHGSVNCLVVSYENPQSSIGNAKANVSNQKQLKQSLYHLTKGRVNTPTIMKNAKKATVISNNRIGIGRSNDNVNGNGSNVNCFNKSKTQSISKSSSRDCSHNANNMFNKAKQVIMEGNSNINSNNKDKHMAANVCFKEVVNINLPKEIDKPQTQAVFNQKNVSKIDTYDNKNIIHTKEKSIETIDFVRNHYHYQHLNQFQSKSKQPMIKSTEIIKKAKELINNRTNLSISNYKSLNKSSGPIMIHDCKSKKEKENVIKTQYIDLAKIDENQPKNEEMLNVIKMSLDDNFKYIFNFSYENFLSKESESQSKQSQD